MNYENKIEQTAKMFIDLELEDFLIVETFINRITMKREQIVEHETRQEQ